MSVRKTKKGWQADFYAGAERIRKAFPTKKEAQDYEGKTRGLVRENKYFDVQREAFDTFSAMLNWYLEQPEVKRKKSRYTDEQLSKALRKFFGKKAPSKITPEEIHEYIDTRLDSLTFMKTPVTRGTVNRELALLKSVFNKAERYGKTYRNPTKAVQKLPGQNVRDRVLSREEWEAYYQECREWYKPIALCAYYTAMRKSEILNLRWNQVDLKTGFIRLQPEDTKTDEGRIVPIAPELDEVLRKLPRSIQKDGPVFTRGGDVIQSLRRAHRHACKKASIEDLKFHDFRHTCITNWRREGHDYMTIMKASGHKTFDVFKRYNSFSEEDVKGLVSKGDREKMVETRK